MVMLNFICPLYRMNNNNSVLHASLQISSDYACKVCGSYEKAQYTFSNIFFNADDRTLA